MSVIVSSLVVIDGLASLATLQLPIVVCSIRVCVHVCVCCCCVENIPDEYSLTSTESVRAKATDYLVMCGGRVNGPMLV